MPAHPSNRDEFSRTTFAVARRHHLRNPFPVTAHGNALKSFEIVASHRPISSNTFELTPSAAVQAIVRFRGGSNERLESDKEQTWAKNTFMPLKEIVKL